MKKLLHLLVFLPVISFTQTFGEIGSSWNTIQTISQHNGPGCHYVNTYKECAQIISDTVIGSDTMQLVWKHKLSVTGPSASISTNTDTIFLFQDSGKVYFGELNDLKLRYDFNLTQGDSFVVDFLWSFNGLGSDTVIVENVDSIVVNGNFRKCISFSDFSYYDQTSVPYTNDGMVWVEGVGDTIYGLYNETLMPLINYSLNCFVENDTSWIGNCDPFYACPWITTGLAQIHPEQFSIYPNPVQDLLQIDVLIDEEYAIHIYDLNGRLVQWNDSLIGNQILDVAGLKKGVYILEISKGESALTQRLVKL
jgi:hypothetical protein